MALQNQSQEPQTFRYNARPYTLQPGEILRGQPGYVEYHANKQNPELVIIEEGEKPSTFIPYGATIEDTIRLFNADTPVQTLKAALTEEAGGQDRAMVIDWLESLIRDNDETGQSDAGKSGIINEGTTPQSAARDGDTGTPNARLPQPTPAEDLDTSENDRKAAREEKKAAAKG